MFHSSPFDRLLPKLPASLRSRRGARRGNALVLVAAVLLMLAIIGMGYVVRTQGSREIASASQNRSIVDNRIDSIAGTVVDEVASSLFVKNVVTPDFAGGDPGLLPAGSAAGVRPVPRSDWPRQRPLPTAHRYGIDPLDYLTNLLDPGDLNNIYGLGADGYPDGFNHAPFTVRPWTNWPDIFGSIYGESNPLGNPGFGDLRWLAPTEPQRASWNGATLVPDPTGNTFSHWAKLSWLPTAENGYRLVPDIGNIEFFLMNGPQGTPLPLPADPTAIGPNTGFGSLGIPYEQWLPGVPPTPLQDIQDFINRRNNWFTPGGYYQAVTTNPFDIGQGPDSSLMLPNCIRLADPLNTGTILTPGTRPTDAGPTRFLADGLTPDNANNTIRNIIERTFADTDGDGITDSFWYLAPSSVDRGVRQLVALRIIDNSSMLNLNVAGVFKRSNEVPSTAVAPAMRETRGHTPADVALVSNLDTNDTPVGFLNSPDNALATGDIASSPTMTVAYDVDNRWAGTAENNPTFLRERGLQRSSADVPATAPGAWDLFGEQLRLQRERTRLFKSGFEDGVVRYFNAPNATLPLPQLVDATLPTYAPGGYSAALSPFTSADEAELRMSHGQNQPFIFSRLERTIDPGATSYAFLRTGEWREESSEWTGKQLTLPELLADNRRKLTTVSAARNETMPPALWTRWWNVEGGRMRAIEPNDPLPWFAPPGPADLQYAYPTLAQLQADLQADPPLYAGVLPSQVFTVGGWRPEVIRDVAGDANRDGVVDARDLDAARRDFFIWNAKQDLRAPIDLDRVGGEQPVVDPVFGVFGFVDPGTGVFVRTKDDVTDSYDHAFSTIEWTRDFRRRALSALKSVYRPIDPATGLPILGSDGLPKRTRASYADRFQLGADMPGAQVLPAGTTEFRPLTGTKRPRSIVADGALSDQVDTAIKSEKITNAMAASLAANAVTARRGPQYIGPFNPGAGGALVGDWYTSQPLLPAFPTVDPLEGNVPDQRVAVDDPDPTLSGSAAPGGPDVFFAGVEGHPVVMEAFFAVVWPKTRLGSSWKFLPTPGATQSQISPKPADPFSIPINYTGGGDESHFVAIVPNEEMVDKFTAATWAGAGVEDWQRQSTTVVAVQVANPFPYPIYLGDFRLEVFGQTFTFPRYEIDANGAFIRGPDDLDGDGLNDPIPLMLGPTTDAEPRTAIVFAISDHNQINYRPGDSDQAGGVQRRYPLTKGVEFDPFFRTRWLDYLDILEPGDLGGADATLQPSGGTLSAPSTAFCPHDEGVLGTEMNQGELTTRFERRRLLGTSRQSRSLFGNNLSPSYPIAQSKIIDATQDLGTDAESFRPNQGINIRRILRNPETGEELGSILVDRFDRDPAATTQPTADPVSGWNISTAAELLLDDNGRFWPPEIDDGQVPPIPGSEVSQMYPLWNAIPIPIPAQLHPIKPTNSTFNGIRINTNDYYVTWTRSSRLWGKDFAVVYGTNGDPVAYDRDPANNNGKGDGLITPDERAPRFALASSKQRPDLPNAGSPTSGVTFADGIGPFQGKSGDPHEYRGAAFQSHVGLSEWVNDYDYNYGASAQPYPLPTNLKNPANSDPTSPGCGDADIVGALVGGIPLKGNHLLPFVRNFTPSLYAQNTTPPQWPPSNFTGDLNATILRVVMKPTNFTTKTVVGLPQGETLPRQIFGLDFPSTGVAGVAATRTFVADKGMRWPATSTTMATDVSSGAPLAEALDQLLPMDGAFVLGHKKEDFDTTAEVMGLMVWGPVYESGGNTKHTLGEILTDRVPGYPVGLVHRYVDLDNDLVSYPYEQNPAWPYLNRIYIDNPSVAFSWFDENGNQATPESQRFLWQWGGSSAAVSPYGSSLPLATRLLDAFTLDDRGTTLLPPAAYGRLPASADMNGDGFDSPNQANETAQWVDDRRFRLAGGYQGKGTPGMINVNTAPLEVLRALPHMSRLVYNDGHDNDGDGSGDLFDVDTNDDWILDDWRQPPHPNANPLVRVAEAIDLYRSRTPAIQDWQANLIYPSRPEPNNLAAIPHYFDRGTTPGDADGDNVQDTGFFPGMRADRGFESLGEMLLLTRNTAAPSATGPDPWSWADNQSWSIRFAGLDPFRLAQAPADNGDSYGGGYRQLNANGDYVHPPYNARISTDAFRGKRMEHWTSGSAVQTREVPIYAPTAGDAREQDLLAASLSNILTTRSDVFTVYLRVRSVKADPTTGRYDGTDPELIVNESRYVMCIDRSEVERPGDQPRIVYFQKVPH